MVFQPLVRLRVTIGSRRWFHKPRPRGVSLLAIDPRQGMADEGMGVPCLEVEVLIGRNLSSRPKTSA